MNYCKKCGAKLEEDGKFCSECGNLILDEKEVKFEKNIDSNTEEFNEEERNENIDEFNVDEKSADDKNEVFNNDIDLEDYIDFNGSFNDEKKSLGKNNDTNNYDNINKFFNNQHDKKEEHNNYNENLDFEDNQDDDTFSEKSKNDFESQKNLNEKNKKKLIIISSVLGFAIIVVLIFLFKDNFLYKVYTNKANETNVISEKIINYNKALKYEYNESIQDSIYNVVKNEADFLDQVKKLDSLKEEDLNKLVSKIYVYNIKKALDKDDYKLADKYLQEAKSKNYEIDKIGNYNELAKSIDDKKTEEKKLKEEEERLEEEEKKAEKRKEEEMKENERLKQEKLTKQNQELSSINDKLSYNYNYSNHDFIVPDSHVRYMTEKELGFYDKHTLSLIRNEIYARHGYVFSTQPYKNYFESKPWYSKNYNFKGTPLNKYEQANIDLILREEKRR